MEQESDNKKELFSCAMRGKWDKVIEMYMQDEVLHKARATPSRDTALHIAAADRKEHVVERMVFVMFLKQPNKEELIKALRTPDNGHNTALHVAAVMGNVRMCHIIASADPTLVDDRNADGETPLFLAALHGRKQAFLLLHYIRNPDSTTSPFYRNCRRNNGDTILHCAISGDYFDLAFRILHLYGELAYWVNEEGLSPLHLLASKPSAFRSGSRLRRMEAMIYHCLPVEELKAEYYFVREPDDSPDYSDISPHCPPNYKTLWSVCGLIRKVVTFGPLVSRTVQRDAEDPGAGGSTADGAQANSLFPANYKTCCALIKGIYLVLSIILGIVFVIDVRKIYRKKETHTWCFQVFEHLLHFASLYDEEDDGEKPTGAYRTLATSVVYPESAVRDVDEPRRLKKRRKETLMLMAAKDGVLEMIEKIFELNPGAIHYVNEDKKNIVLLAVEHRQPHVYEFLLKKNVYKESLFRQVDKHGNSALHLAATLGDYRPWLSTGEALQMQWELKWYEFVENSMPPGFIRPYNNRDETAKEIFTRTHGDLVKSGGEWFKKTSESCSVVAALIATVAFATATTVPGGVNQESGYPTLETETAFKVFATSSLVALCCSVMGVLTFLSLLTSRFQEQDFHKDLPMKLLVGLTLLLVSIASMMVSFCAGHFFVLKHQLHRAAFALYAVTCISVIFYVLAQFPLYFDYLWATFVRLPQRS